MISSYEKIWVYGHPRVSSIREGLPVSIQEKIDGSQFSFMRHEGGALEFRSKRARVYGDCPPDLFKPTVEHLQSVVDQIPPGIIFRGEALKSRHHNHLTYDRAPKGHFVLFDMHLPGGEFSGRVLLEQMADLLGVELVRELHYGPLPNQAGLEAFLVQESQLGGPPIEGFVIKPVEAQYAEDGKRILAKYVSEVFKEEQRKSYRAANPTKTDTTARVAGIFRTPARYRKAVQALQERGDWTGTPRDIGVLLSILKEDIRVEGEATIKELLFAAYIGEILRQASHGFPEWYKNEYLPSCFKEGVADEGE